MAKQKFNVGTFPFSRQFYKIIHWTANKGVVCGTDNFFKMWWNFVDYFLFKWQLFFLNIIVSLIQLGCPGLLVHNFNAQQKLFHENFWVFVRWLLSKDQYVSFTDNVSVPQKLDYSVNPGFAKLISSTDSSSTFLA